MFPSAGKCPGSVYRLGQVLTCPFINLNILFTTSIIPHDCRNPAPDIPARSIPLRPISPLDSSFAHSPVLFFCPINTLQTPALFPLFSHNRLICFQQFPHSCHSLPPSSSTLSLPCQERRSLLQFFASICNRLSLFSALSGLFCKKQGVWVGTACPAQILVTTLLSSAAARSWAAVALHCGCFTSGASSASGIRTKRRRCMRG